MKKNNIIPYIIWGVTIAVYVIVVVLHDLPPNSNPPYFAKYLPMINACLNGTAFIVLILAFIFIKKRFIVLHKTCTLTACILSILFLLSYVLYHYLCGPTKYDGDYNSIYKFILISHILLAGGSLPFIMLTLYRGLQGDFTRHKKLAKIIFPIWLYVTFTGVCVYFFLSKYYKCVSC